MGWKGRVAGLVELTITLLLLGMFDCYQTASWRWRDLTSPRRTSEQIRIPLHLKVKGSVDAGVESTHIQLIWCHVVIFCSTSTSLIFSEWRWNVQKTPSKFCIASCVSTGENGLTTAQSTVHMPHSHTHSYTDDRGYNARRQLLIRSNLWFSILLKDTSTCN